MASPPSRWSGAPSSRGAASSQHYGTQQSQQRQHGSGANNAGSVLNDGVNPVTGKIIRRQDGKRRGATSPHGAPIDDVRDAGSVLNDGKNKNGSDRKPRAREIVHGLDDNDDNVNGAGNARSRRPWLDQGTDALISDSERNARAVAHDPLVALESPDAVNDPRRTAFASTAHMSGVNHVKDMSDVRRRVIRPDDEIIGGGSGKRNGRSPSKMIFAGTGILIALFAVFKIIAPLIPFL